MTESEAARSLEKAGSLPPLAHVAIVGRTLASRMFATDVAAENLRVAMSMDFSRDAACSVLGGRPGSPARLRGVN